MTALRDLVAVWASACADLSRLARDLDADDWQRPTDLEGWCVQDVMAHCAAVESELSGVPPLRVEIDKSAPHITSPADVYTERGVVGRRGRRPTELIEEFDQAVAEHALRLAAEPLDDPTGAPPITPGRIPWDWATFLRNRPLDIWVHEQDIRRAVDRRGNLDSAAARHTQGVFGYLLPYVVAKLAGAQPGQSVVVEITGPVPSQYGVRVDESGRGKPASAADLDPDARLVTDTETFAILGAGRRAPDTLPVVVAGDQDLASRVMRSLNLTP